MLLPPSGYLIVLRKEWVHVFLLRDDLCSLYEV